MKFLTICIALLLSTGALFGAPKPKNSPADTITGTFWDTRLPAEKRSELLVSRLSIEEKAAMMLHNSAAVNRLGIPAYNWWNEGLHGVARAGRATVFPEPIGLAATFDEDLTKRIATAISDEARAKHNEALRIGSREMYTGLSFWSPNINIFRDPRWGRGMETWGEDPDLTGTLGTAFVKGMQGDKPGYLKTAACAKHYVVHSGPEGERHTFNVVPTKKDFFETYTPAFEQLVKEGGVETVMCAYTSAFDEPCCGNRYLLQDLLRNNWGFRGHIVSDCWAIVDFHEGHKATKTEAESAAMAIKAGVNLNCGIAYRSIPDAVKAGLITEKEVDSNLKTLLVTRFKLGLLDPKGTNPYDNIPASVIDCPEHRALALESAQKSVILLKNNGVLPLRKDLPRLFVIGPMAADVDAMLGNYNGLNPKITTIIEGIAGEVSLGTRLEYRHGFTIDRENINTIGWALGEANEADVTIAVIGINTLLEGEEGESILSHYKSDRTDINLPASQLKYLRELRNNGGKPLIVIVTGGSPLNLTEVHEIADAVLFVWYPGEEGGTAVADILFGDISPSGKLPITFPKSVEQLPAYDDYSMIGRTYKYMEQEPMYPFGFGLSYTQFAYSPISVTTLGDNTQVKVTVSNSGKVVSEEVVQLYISDRDAAFRVPKTDLKGFKRLNLAPGASEEVVFDLTKADFMVINEAGEKVFDKGMFKLSVGGSSPFSRCTELGASQYTETTINL